MSKIIDITSLTDTQMEAVLAFKAEDNSFPWGSLSTADLLEVSRVTGADFSLWIGAETQRRAFEQRNAEEEEISWAEANYYEGEILAAADNSYL